MRDLSVPSRSIGVRAMRLVGRRSRAFLPRRLHMAVAWLLLGVAVLQSGIAGAAEHTWIPREQRLSNGTISLPGVTVIGNKITWGGGGFDIGFPDAATALFSSGSSGLGAAITSAKLKAYNLSDICKNPYISPETRTTTSGSSLTQRWMAAQDVFNTIAIRNLYGCIRQPMEARVSV
jgi:hypothetical protein